MIAFADRTDADDRPTDRVERLADLPPSAKLVFFVLEREGPLTATALAEEALLPSRTMRDAVNTLEGADLVEETPYLLDARKKAYRAREIDRERGDG